MRKNTDFNLFNLLKFISAAAAIFLVLSCAENRPEINQVFWQINKIRNLDTGRYHDSLSLFIEANDEDGIEDLKTIYLINDSEELFWKITEKNWVHKTDGEANWFGSGSITMNDFSAFPFGKYRAIIIDEAGEREETSFNINKYETGFIENDFPAAGIRGNAPFYSPGTEALWFYNKEMKLIKEVSVNASDVKNIQLPSEAQAMYAYKYDRIKGFGLITGPYMVKHQD
jgi:hypothetical protein